MARLPRIEQTEIVENIGVVRANPSAGRGLMNIGRALSGLAERANAEARKKAIAEATVRGRNAVTLDENGEIRIEPLPAPDSAANRAFLAAAETGYMAHFANIHQRAATEAQNEHLFDADGFDGFWAGHTDGALSQVPEPFKGRAREILADLGQRNRDSILNRTVNRDFALSQAEWDARLKNQEDQLGALAAAGEIASPAYAKLAAEYEAALRAGVSARFINKDHAKLRRETTADEGEALNIASWAIVAYRAAGRGAEGIKAAEDKLAKILDDPELDIPESRRQRIVDVTQERIREEEGVRRQQAMEVRADAQDALRKLDLGFPVPRGEIDRLAERAKAAGDHEFAANLKTAATVQEDIARFGRMPLAEQSRKIQALDEVLQKGGGSAADAERLVGYMRAYTAKAQALKDDAWSYGVRAHKAIVGAVGPLDWSRTENIAGALADRVKQAEKLAEIEGVPVLPMSKEELGRLSGAIAVADEREKAMLGAILADGLGPGHLPRVLNELISKDADARLFAAASGIALDSPDVARQIFRGAAVAKANPKVMPENSETLRDTINSEIGDALVLRPDVRGLIVETAMALYADAANTAGDFSGRLDPDRLREAIKIATGGIVTHNSRKIIAPRRGMSQREFDAIMDGLTDADLGSVPPKAADGSVVTAQMIREHGDLYSVGDGRYEVRFYGFEITDPLDPLRRYTLDLRDVAPGTLAAEIRLRGPNAP